MLSRLRHGLAQLVFGAPVQVLGVAVVSTVYSTHLAAQQRDAQAARPLNVDDLLMTRHIRQLSLSPNGEYVEWEITRPQTDSVPGDYLHSFLGGLSHSDVVVIELGHKKREMQKVIGSRSSYYASWSPNGDYLAFIAVGPSDSEPHLYVRNVKTGATDRIADAAVELGGLLSDGKSWRPYLWVNDSTLLCLLLPTGQLSVIYDEGSRMMRAAPVQWARARAGQFPSASILDARLDQGRQTVDSASLTMIGTRSHRLHSIVRAPIEKGALVAVLNPAHDALFIEEQDSTPRVDVDTTEEGLDDPPVLRGYVVDLDGRTGLKLRALLRADHTCQDDPSDAPPAWSPGGRWLITWSARDDAHETTCRTPILLDTYTGFSRAIDVPGHVPMHAVWIDAKYFLMRADTAGRDSADSGRKGGWWVGSVDHDSLRSLRVKGGNLPTDLIPSGRPGVAYYVQGGKLWSVDVTYGADRLLFGDSTIKVEAVLWSNINATADNSKLILRTYTNGAFQLVLLTLAPRQPIALTLGLPGTATIVDYVPSAHQTIAAQMAQRGRSLVIDGSDLGRGQDTLLVFNEHLSRVATGTRTLIRYSATDGDSLTGLLLLPPWYQPGRRCPLVVWVYGGALQTDTLVAADPTDSDEPINLGLLTAKGYAVLIPSIPLPPDGVASDHFFEMTNGVAPAIDRVVALGIADPDRIAVMGHSYGGYTVYSLIEQTQRFKAAIVYAGPADVLSGYGTFTAEGRYTSDPLKSMLYKAAFEAGQFGFTVPPSRDLWRYLRNNPIAYLDRVQTPLLLIHGDADFVPIQQAEEVYTQLSRLHRPVRFVRYWGEGHIITSPANIRHLWGEILGWLEHYIGCDGADDLHSCHRPTPPYQSNAVPRAGR
jgi:dipeptidyl aminopeptidase/acylaminoacyl peptidase